MRENYHKKLREVDRARNREVDKKALEDKIRKCYGKVKLFVDKEIAKGIPANEAIEKILNNQNVIRTYPNLNDDKVRRVIKRVYLNTYYNKSAKTEKEGDER